MASTKTANKKKAPSKAERASTTVQRVEELVVLVCATADLGELKTLHDQIARLDVFRAVGPTTIQRLNGVVDRLTERIASLGPTSAASSELERIRNTITSA